jgi:hypothetical protein
MVPGDVQAVQWIARETSQAPAANDGPHYTSLDELRSVLAWWALPLLTDIQFDYPHFDQRDRYYTRLDCGYPEYPLHEASNARALGRLCFSDTGGGRVPKGIPWGKGGGASAKNHV